MGIELNFSRTWPEKVPSPTGSDDSGLGWSSDTADCRFQMESPVKMNSNCFNFSEAESACSPQSQGECKTWLNDFEVHPKYDADLQAFNLDQKSSVTSDIFDCILEQKPDQVISSQQQNKKANSKSNKKKQTPISNSPSAKLERCFQPKTGNGKPRQTSVKRKPSQKCPSSYPYPGVRVLTVREKLKKMRERPSSNRTPPSAQSPTSGQCQTLPQPMPYQQNFSQAHQPFQDMYNSIQHPSLGNVQTPANISLAGGTSPLHHISPNYPSARPFQYDLNNIEYDRVCDSYANSVSSNSPTHSSQCSSPQYPSSPELSPGMPMHHMLTSMSPCGEIKSPTIPYHSSMNPTENLVASFDAEQATCRTSTYPAKVYQQNPYNIDGYSPYEISSSSNQQSHLFGNQNQTSLSYDIVAQLFESARCGDCQTMQQLLEYKPEHLNIRDEVGKSALFYAVEYGQLDVMELLISMNCDVGVLTAEGYNILHAATCSKTDVLVHLLKSLQLNDIQRLLNKPSVKTGFTPLHLAAKKQQLNNLIQLLNYGANFLSQDCFGCSPLHIAVQNGDIMSARALIGAAMKNQKAKELICQPDVSLNTPLHLAADLCNAGDDKRKHQLDIIKLLISNNADQNAFNAERRRPLDLLPIHNTSSQVLNARYVLSGARNGGCAIDMLPSMAYPYCNLYNGVVSSHSH